MSCVRMAGSNIIGRAQIGYYGLPETKLKVSGMKKWAIGVILRTGEYRIYRRRSMFIFGPFTSKFDLFFSNSGYIEMRQRQMYACVFKK